MPESTSIFINESIRKKMALYFTSHYGRVSNLSLDKYIRDTLSLERAENEIVLMRKKVPFDIRNKKLLEIGSGFGAFIINSMIQHSTLSYGVEPESVCYETSRDLLTACGISPGIIKNACGENLPYEDNFFDLVYSSNVIEHVQDPEAVFSEALRVLRPGGYIFFVIPNYGSWWDGHYGIFWLPNMSKNCARWYVKLLGRAPEFIDSLQLLNQKQIGDITRNFARQLEILDWGWDVWEERLSTLNFSEWADLYKLKRILKLFRRFRLIKFITYLGRKFNWINPIILVGRKR